MKFLPLFMITLLGSNASLFCMDEDDAKKAHEQQEETLKQYKDYGRWDRPEYAERPTEQKEDSLASLLAEVKEESEQLSNAEHATFWEETEPLITEMNEEDFGQPAVAPATSNLPAHLENDDADAKVLAALRFRSDFQKLADADQTMAFMSLKRHKITCKKFAQGPLGNVDANRVATIWQWLAMLDCQKLAYNSPVRSLLMRHGVRVAQRTEDQEISSFMHPSVLSLFGEELAGNIRKISATIDQTNTECGIDENPDKESAVILLAFPLIKKECVKMFDLQTRLRCALEGTKPDLDYARIKAAKRETVRQEAEALRQGLRARLLMHGLGEHEHNAEGECVDMQGNPAGCHAQ
jgi:hypothetical protein